MTDSTNLVGTMEAAAQAAGWGERAALVVGDRWYTHAEVHAGVARAASLLAERGVGTGERVLLVLPDGVEFVWAFLATLRLGAIAVPVNPGLTADEHRYMAADADASLVVCEPGLVRRFSVAGAVVTDGDIVVAATSPGTPHPVVEVGADAPAYAQYTSGTTGSPKAALHRHGDPLVYVDAFARGAIDMRADDVVLSVSKMFFAYGLGNSLFFPLLTGAKAVLHPGHASAEDVAQLVEAHGVTVLFAVPTFYARLATTAVARSFGFLRVAVSAGETLTVALHRRTEQLLGCPLLDGLGSTEVGQTFTSNTLDRAREGTVGVPLPPYEVTVRDEGGSEVAPGDVGALWVRGPTIMLEYLGNPEATAAARSGPWLRTADRAVIDSDGFVHHRGRADDIEIVGGICVWPVEIEEVLSEHRRVAEVAVAGVRDAGGGSRLEAFVVPAPGGPGTDSMAAELLELAASRLAPHKVPRQVHLVAALPRTPTGKLRRFVLRSGTASEPGGAVTPGAG